MSNKSKPTVNNADIQSDQLDDIKIGTAEKTIKPDSADSNKIKSSNTKAKATGKKTLNTSSDAEGKKNTKAKAIATDISDTNFKNPATDADNNDKASVVENNARNTINKSAATMESDSKDGSLATDDKTTESSEPIIIVGGASEYVFEPEHEDNPIDDYDELEDEEKRETKEKNLRIIEGGGKEIVIDDAPSISDRSSATPACTRNKVKDKKIGDIGTYIAIGFFIITIIISLFNIKGMRYPLSCFFLSLAALTMGVTTILRMLNNKKCDCVTCKTQNKTFLYSAGLWFLVFLGALIAFLVLILR